MESATDVLEPVKLPLEQPLNSRVPHFNRENASAYGKRSAQLRREREAQRQAEEATLKAAILTVGNSPVALIAEHDDYRRIRLTRVREQLTELDKAFSLAMDSADSRQIKAICDSIARLAEVERVLAGRPDPGSRRPGRDKPSRERPPAEPIE